MKLSGRHPPFHLSTPDGRKRRLRIFFSTRAHSPSPAEEPLSLVQDVHDPSTPFGFAELRNGTYEWDFSLSTTSTIDAGPLSSTTNIAHCFGSFPRTLLMKASRNWFPISLPFLTPRHPARLVLGRKVSQMAPLLFLEVDS